MVTTMMTLMQVITDLSKSEATAKNILKHFSLDPGRHVPSSKQHEIPLVKYACTKGIINAFIIILPSILYNDIFIAFLD